VAELRHGVDRSADGQAAATADDRPFAPGDYPLVVVGSGPGAIQVSHSLHEHGIDHAVISADPSPGGMFRRWPFFQRLLSWTKPYAPVDRSERAYERYDWNSLLADGPGQRAIMPEFMDGTSYFPSRPEMERNLATFVERTGLAIRYGCRWTATRREDGPDGTRFVLTTTDGEYRAPVLVFAVGVSEPYAPATPGIELTANYGDTRPAETYAGRRIFILGKQNSGFELASGLLPWARRITLASIPDRSSASGRATSSRSRTTCSAAACRCSMPRSARSSGPKAAPLASSSGFGRRRAVRSSRSRPTR
jgi:thioredoxin reductase